MKTQPCATVKSNHPKITPFLWFDSQAKEAVSFYTSIFKNSKIVSITRYGEEGAEASILMPLSNPHGRGWHSACIFLSLSLLMWV